MKEEAPEIMFANLTEEEQIEYVFRQGRTEGLAEGLAEGRTEVIRNLMNNLKMTAEQAMDAMGIAASEQEHYLSLL